MNTKHLNLRTILKDMVVKNFQKNGYIDLLNTLEIEIKSLNLKDNPYKIARYIYIRLGEIFDYDPKLLYASKEEKEKLKQKRVDIRCVTDLFIICDSYSYMYQELLNHFNIKAKVVDIKEHVYVLYEIDNKTYLADLTSNNEDISRIKFGLPITLNRMIYPNAPRVDDTFTKIDEDIYHNNVKTEDVLEIVKQDLSQKKDYEYQVFKWLENYFEFNRPFVGFISGITFIYQMIKYFLPNYQLSNTHICDDSNCLEGEIIHYKDNIYFGLFEEDGYFRFRETNLEEIDNIFNSNKLSI